jgi:hypothetical protein
MDPGYRRRKNAYSRSLSTIPLAEPSSVGPEEQEIGSHTGDTREVARSSIEYALIDGREITAW